MWLVFTEGSAVLLGRARARAQARHGSRTRDRGNSTWGNLDAVTDAPNNEVPLRSRIVTQLSPPILHT